MTRTRASLGRLGILTVAALCMTAGGVVRAQDQPAKNPLQGNEPAIQAGMGIFRSRCADCHGMDASGVRAPDLRQVWASGRTDSGLFQTLRNGVPGTEMPPVLRATDDDLWRILAYLRTIAAPVPTDVPAGNVANGERVFRAQCTSCHRANGRGGHLGPDLSRVGVSRSRAVVVRRIRGAMEDFTAGFEPVTVTTKTGQAVQGVKKNEDLFSVQVMDSRERIQGYLKSDVGQVTDGKQSAMPVFGPDRLSESDLTDLLGYLATLKGFDPSVGK